MNQYNNDICYLMTLRNMITNRSVKIFDYCGIYCFSHDKSRQHISDFMLDSSFLSYLDHEPVMIDNIRLDCIDHIMRQLYQDIQDGMLERDFIALHSNGIRKFLNYCSRRQYVKHTRTNRYVIHYLSHKMRKRRRRR